MVRTAVFNVIIDVISAYSAIADFSELQIKELLV